MPRRLIERLRGAAPELVLAALAAVLFLGCLGSVGLWGKREQRAAAEAIDTIDHGRWLVAQIQGRPRLEKPPLPRWTVAGLMLLTGRRDEWIVRLPAAFAALGMVGLTYAMGRRLRGRPEGVAAGLALASTVFFIAETRQAGNDGPLAFFTTLALYGALRRLHGGAGPLGEPAEQLGSRRWSWLLYGATGLGFLSKGPIAVILVGLALVLYLALCRRLRPGLRALADGPGAVLLLALALAWPVPVLLDDPNAARVWYLEMAQKAGSAGIKHRNHRVFLASEWPGMTAPWTALGLSAALLPLLRRTERTPAAWLPWGWAMGNLAMFCLWKVAKPNYYLPCLPAVALMAGAEWVRLCRLARRDARGAATARRLLQSHWGLIFAGAVAAPVVLAKLFPAYLAAGSALAAVLAAATLASAWAWRRGADAMAMAPLVAAVALGTVVGYGMLGPATDDLNSHRALARRLERLIPPGQRRVPFFHELDEGLWFYLRGHDLEPIPDSHPGYNNALELVEMRETNPELVYNVQARLDRQERILKEWLGDLGASRPYFLMKASDYDLFARGLAGRVEPVYREDGLERNELILLRVAGGPAVAAEGAAPPRR